MNEVVCEFVLEKTGATKILSSEVIQELWSGYGQIEKVKLQGVSVASVVVKHVKPPQSSHHPRGWNTNLSHQRKLKSYEVETAWYQQWSRECDDSCRVPLCFGVAKIGEEVVIIMEDLDASGFAIRKSTVSWSDIVNCLSWLANFHATFLENEPEQLWETGTYWHLATRPDELKELEDLQLKEVAQRLDEKLNKASFKTFVHGDAKLANFCFSDDGESVAGVDFQYVGGGCGMKDVAYFIGSCLNEGECESKESQLLDVYFAELLRSVKEKKPAVDHELLEKEWRALFSIAWTDFHRFLKGWSPDHWKINSYSEKMARQVIKDLNNETGK